MKAFVIILGVYRENIYSRHGYESVTYEKTWPAFNTWQTAKGLAAVSILVGLFFTSIPREISAICIAGLLLCSRKMKTRDILGLIDWHLLTLFCSLFILGSIANLIVIEQAGIFGIRITFKQHAAVGIPVTLVSLIVLIGWIFVLGS